MNIIPIMRLVRFLILYLKGVFLNKKFICEHSQESQIKFSAKKRDTFSVNRKSLHELRTDIVNIFAFV